MKRSTASRTNPQPTKRQRVSAALQTPESMPGSPAGVPLGAMSVTTFLRRHWQRKPLLVRQALRQDDDDLRPITRAALGELATRDDVESRLVCAADRRGRWSLEHGPFERLPRRRSRPWTLLVQGVDLELACARSLLDRFRFLPDARIDDVMCSYAVDGGGVGPHVDSYDVFLLQVRGRRRWSIAPPAERPRVPGQPVRLVAPFDATDVWELEPGDMLYLPPGWAHDGVALGECITASIGFRAPSRGEVLNAFHAHRIDDGIDDPDHDDAADVGVGRPRSACTREERRRAALRERYRDPAHAAASARTLDHPARLPEPMVATLVEWIENARLDRERIVDFIGRHLTEPKPHVWFESPQSAKTPFQDRSTPGHAAGAVRLNPRTRLMYRGDRVYINGEVDRVPARSRPLLHRLADQRQLATAETARACADPWLRATLARWWSNGWLGNEDE